MPGDVGGTGTPMEGFPGGGSEVAPVMPAPVDAVPAGVEAPGEPQVIPQTATTSGQQAGNVQEYEALLKEQRAIQGGMQKTIDALKAQVAVEQQKNVGLQAQIQELQNKTVEASSGEIVDLRQKVQNLETEKAVWEGQLAAKDQEKERVILLAKEYPSLAGPLLEANAVPQTADDAAFRAAMDKLVGNVTAQAEAVYQAQVSSARPAVSPQSEPLPDLKTLRKQHQAAIKSGDKKEIERLGDLWFQATGAADLPPG
jgi:chromosome segregation ATPase